MELNSIIYQCFPAATVKKGLLVQSLWSGYGEITRCYLSYPKDTSNGFNSPNTIIVKSVTPPDNGTGINNPHPRGWSGSISHQRKLTSYQVETHWYRHWVPVLPTNLNLPTCYYTYQSTEQNSSAAYNNDSWVIVMSDLDAQGYSKRRSSLTPSEAKICLKWLAKFHAQNAIDNPISTWPEGLWSIGSYWHLSTRSQEWEAMPPSLLKQHAEQLDNKLNSCRFKTIIHGDAKVANFCFNDDLTDVAAVDFQYVGGGCGIKDVVYFLGSCLNTKQLDQNYQSLLDYYFTQLEQSLEQRPLESKEQIDAKALITEWRSLFYIAWADFNRFIIGWAPEHSKNNHFSEQMTKKAIESII